MKIAEDTGLIQQDVYAVIQKTLDYITESLAKGDNVELRNFGVFEVRERKQRVGRNPNKPEQVVTIPSRKVVKFKPGKIMRQQVSDGFEPESTPAVDPTAETVVMGPGSVTPATPPTTPPTSTPAAGGGSGAGAGTNGES
jgi:nucleoid DNA-binding protein